MTVADGSAGSLGPDPSRALANLAAPRPPLWWTLVRHEWRLTMRDVRGGRRGKAARVVPRKRARRVVAYAAAAVVLHLGGALALLLPSHWRVSPASRVAAALVVAFLFTLMLSTAMSRIVAAFHERRDLDLLLAAPIPGGLILAVRAGTVALAVAALFAVFVYPIADVGVASGRWWLASLYPLVPAMALMATAVALAITDVVVRAIGVRRARVGLQIFSALVGASFYLASQARQFLPQADTARLYRWLAAGAQDGHVAWPLDVAARLAGGDVAAWVVLTSASVVLFAASVRHARRRFVDVARTPEADGRVVHSDRAVVARRIAAGFARGPFATLLVKEWRLILRAPQLLSQILLQLLYLVPLMFAAFGRHGAGSQAGGAWSAAAFAAGIVGVAGTLATALTWLTVAAEDAPDLLAGSPRTRATILMAKLAAGALPPVAIVAVAALGTGRRSIVDAMVVFGFGVLSCASAAVLAAGSQAVGKRTDFQRRHRGRGLWALVDALQFLLWASTAGAAVAGHWIASVCLAAVALAIVGAATPRALERLSAAD